MHAANQHARTLRLGDLSQAIDQLQLEESEEGRGRGVGGEAASLNFLLFPPQGMYEKRKEILASPPRAASP